MRQNSADRDEKSHPSSSLDVNTIARPKLETDAQVTLQLLRDSSGTLDVEGSHSSSPLAPAIKLRAGPRLTPAQAGAMLGTPPGGLPDVPTGRPLSREGELSVTGSGDAFPPAGRGGDGGECHHPSVL